MKLGCKAACMTAGVSPAAVDGMSAALGINLLAGQKVNPGARHMRREKDKERMGRGRETQSMKDTNEGTVWAHGEVRVLVQVCPAGSQ